MIIVGGGIVGASFAYHAKKIGVKDISLLTATLPGDNAQATSNSWGWVNGYAPDDKNYSIFRLANLEYWPRLLKEINSHSKSSIGAFFWDMHKTKLSDTIAQHQNWGHSVKKISKDEISFLLPKLINKPDIAGFGLNDLALEGSKVTKDLVRASSSKIIKSNVKRIVCQKNKVIGVETDQGIIYNDEVIIAAGLGTPDLLSSIDINFKMNSSLGLLAYTKPLSDLYLKHPITGIDFHVRQDNKGRLVIGGKFNGDSSKEENIKEVAEKLVKDMALRLKYDGVITLDHYTLGARPLPIDGRPKIGRIKNDLGDEMKGIYIAVMHSGITNAPLAGKLGIEEIITGKKNSLISDFLPQRFDKIMDDKNV